MVTLFEEVAAERIRQNEKHPVNPKYLFCENWKRKDTRGKMFGLQKMNDAKEAKGKHDYISLIQEELYEIVCARDKEERHTEIVQAIALLVRLDEDTEV